MSQLKKTITSILIILIVTVTFTSCGKMQSLEKLDKDIEQLKIELQALPEDTDEAYAVLANNEPEFTEEDMTTESFEFYSELDSEGRCGVVYANLGLDLMPTVRCSSMTKPSTWTRRTGS